MGFLKNLFGGASAKPEKRYYTFNVKCNRCGEIIEGRVDLDNDLSLDDEGDNVYFGRKVVMGSGHCFQQIEVEMKFNSSRELLEQQVTGGQDVAGLVPGARLRAGLAQHPRPDGRDEPAVLGDGTRRALSPADAVVFASGDEDVAIRLGLRWAADLSARPLRRAT